MEAAIAVSLLKKILAPCVLLFAKKDSTLTVQQAEYVRQIRNGMELSLNVKVS